MNAHTTTWNGAVSNVRADVKVNDSYNGRVSVFFHAVRGIGKERFFSYLEEAAKESLADTIVLIFHLRDCRGGKGERALGRLAFTWLSEHYPEEFRKVVHLIPNYGRYDDLLTFFPQGLDGTDFSNFAVTLFAKQLQQDLECMQQGKPCSVAAKWTPSENCKSDRDRSTFATLANALKVTPAQLRKKYNTPLRAYLHVVEKYMCSRDWSKIDYSKVPSYAMTRLRKSFVKNDKVRFTEWSCKLALKDPTVKVNAGQLYPHDLIQQIECDSRTTDSVIQAQWDALVEKTRKLGNLGDAISMVDVSGSMIGLPMRVAVAMGLMIGELAQGTFHNHLITFHSNPSFKVVSDSHLGQRYREVTEMGWGMSTNIEQAFKLILDRGIACSLTDADMPKRLFIISDMQFNQATGGKTNFETIEKLYAVAGFTRPQIVFWNVNGAIRDFPVTVDDSGTALVSGFSPSILSSMLEKSKIDTITIIRDVIDSDRYAPVISAIVANDIPKVFDLDELSQVSDSKPKEQAVQTVVETESKTTDPEVIMVDLVESTTTSTDASHRH